MMAIRSRGAGIKLIGAALCTFAASPVSAGPPALPPSSFVLLWAAWCAPCRAEIDEFDRLANAARPRETIVWATGDDERSRAMLSPVPAAQRRFTRDTLPALYKRLGISGPVALPVALMTDGKGRICATIRGGAKVSAIERVKRDCDASEAKL